MTTNPYRDSDSGDYLNKVKQHMLENRAGNTASGSFTPRYIIPVAESVTATDAASVDPNKVEATDSVTTSDDATATGYTTGAFVIAEYGDGSDQTNEIKIDFFDIGGV